MKLMGIERKKNVVLRKLFFTFFLYTEYQRNDLKEHIAVKHLIPPVRLCEIESGRLVRLSYSNPDTPRFVSFKGLRYTRC